MKPYLQTALLFALAYLLAPTMASAETLYACKLNVFGTIRMIGAATNCSQYETKISWNSTGATGPAGPQGPAGAMGPQGIQGPAGTQGAQGVSGPQGPKGDTGPMGATGAAGAIGPTGPQGTQGQQGIQGPKGDKGDPGAPGTGGLTCTAPNGYLVIASGALTCQPRYFDNGDGTVTDNKTGLMWEKKTGVVGTWNWSDVHDVNNTYMWNDHSPYSDPNGMLYTEFLAKLNQNVTPSSGAGCFANRCDWRIPNVRELDSIREVPITGCGGFAACIGPEFGPTQALGYWSSTSSTSYISEFAHFSWFGEIGGSLAAAPKRSEYYARAVRGGR